MDYKINIKQGSFRILSDLLGSTGWCKTTQDIIVSGGLLARLPEESIPDRMTVSEFTTWAAKLVAEFTITEKERDTVKKCIKHFVEEGKVPGNKYATELLLAFGYDDK